MKLREIQWKEQDGAIRGYVGGCYLFSYFYDNYDTCWKLVTKLPYPPRTFPTSAECPLAAKAMLQKFASNLYEN